MFKQKNDLYTKYTIIYKRMGIKYSFSELLSFIRIENGLFTSGVAISGYLIFNQLSSNILPLFFAMFFGTGASYAYNYLKDRREDIINKNRLNKFVLEGGKGMFIVVSLYFLGFISSLSFSLFSWITYMFLIVISVLYSGWIRIKEKFLIKNLNTGLGISLSFMVGAMVSGFVYEVMFSYALIVFMLGFAANILGDIRGYKGDRSIGMLTLPMLFGFEKTKGIIYSIISFISISVLFLNYIAFYPLIPFIVTSVVLLSKNHMRGTRALMLSSFAFLPLFLILAKVMGVG